MAFRVLSSDEFELLTENQRKSYEEELAVYNERVKFAEQLERFENMVITPYRPKFPVIPEICRAPGQEFVKPEYGFTKIVRPSKPESKVEHLCFSEPGKPILPKIRKTAVSVHLFRKIEQQPPVLPTIMKISIPDSTFKIKEQISPDLPIVERPENFTGLFFVPVTIESPVIVEKNLKPAVPVAEVPAFSAPEYIMPILKRPGVEIPKIKVSAITGKVSAVLPKVIIPDQVNVLWKSAGERRAEVPKVSGTPAVDVLFHRPDIQKTELPVLPKTVIPTKKFEKPEYAISDLPVVDVPKTDIPQFSAPVSGKSALPAMMKPDRIPEPCVRPSLDYSPKIEHPSIQVLSVRPMKEIHARAGGLPALCAVILPDTHAEELLEILLPVQKGDESGKGSFA